MTLHLDSVDIVSLIKQVRYELADKIEASGVDFRFTLPDEKADFAAGRPENLPYL